MPKLVLCNNEQPCTFEIKCHVSNQKPCMYNTCPYVNGAIYMCVCVYMRADPLSKRDGMTNTSEHNFQFSSNSWIRIGWRYIFGSAGILLDIHKKDSVHIYIMWCYSQANYSYIYYVALLFPGQLSVLFTHFSSVNMQFCALMHRRMEANCEEPSSKNPHTEITSILRLPSFGHLRTTCHIRVLWTLLGQSPSSSVAPR